MDKIKVAIVTADFSIGGGQQVVYELARNLDPNVVDVRVICYGGHADTELDKPRKISNYLFK